MQINLVYDVKDIERLILTDMKSQGYVEGKNFAIESDIGDGTLFFDIKDVLLVSKTAAAAEVEAKPTEVAKSKSSKSKTTSTSTTPAITNTAGSKTSSLEPVELTDEMRALITKANTVGTSNLAEDELIKVRAYWRFKSAERKLKKKQEKEKAQTQTTATNGNSNSAGTSTIVERPNEDAAFYQVLGPYLAQRAASADKNDDATSNNITLASTNTEEIEKRGGEVPLKNPF